MHKVVFKNLPTDIKIEEFTSYLNSKFTTKDVFPILKNDKFTGVCFVTFKEDAFTVTKYYNKSFYKNMRIICEIFVEKGQTLSKSDQQVEEFYINYTNKEKTLKKEEFVNILHLNLPSLFKTDSAVNYFFKEQELVNKIKEFFFNNNIHLHKLTNKKSNTKLLVRGYKEINTPCKIINGPNSLINIYEFNKSDIKNGIKELEKSIWEFMPLCECQIKNDIKFCLEKEEIKKIRKEKYKNMKEKKEKKGRRNNKINYKESSFPDYYIRIKEIIFRI